VENWLASVSEEPEQPPRVEDVGIKASEEDDQVRDRPPSERIAMEEDDQVYDGPSFLDKVMEEHYPNIAKHEDFLRGTRSFKLLIRDAMLALLPIELRQALRSIPKEQISVSHKQDISISNAMKAWIEDNTQARWNWWPLEPRKRNLGEGKSRMFWQCVSPKRLDAGVN
jgi:hypothetical protein